MTFDEIPWTDPIVKTKTYFVFTADIPQSANHVIFVPKEASWNLLADCYKAAYMWGHGWMEDKVCDGFNLAQDVGEAAGQTVEYPCVHLIPR